MQKGNLPFITTFMGYLKAHRFSYEPSRLIQYAIAHPEIPNSFEILQFLTKIDEPTPQELAAYLKKADKAKNQQVIDYLNSLS